MPAACSYVALRGAVAYLLEVALVNVGAEGAVVVAVVALVEGRLVAAAVEAAADHVNHQQLYVGPAA